MDELVKVLDMLNVPAPTEDIGQRAACVTTDLLRVMVILGYITPTQHDRLWDKYLRSDGEVGTDGKVT